MVSLTSALPAAALAVLVALTAFSDQLMLATYTEVAADAVFVVSGTSSGIGNGIASKLVEEGYHVFATVRKEKDAAKLREQMPGAANLHPILLDIGDPEQIERGLQTVKDFCREEGRSFGGLVNNAGILTAGPMEHMPFEKHERTVLINLVAHMRFTKAFLPLLLEAKGRVINIGSLAGILHPGCNAAYNAAKSGLHAYSNSLRREVQHKGVGVSLIAMGETRGTALHENRPSGVSWEGYEKQHKAFDQGALWMRNSFLGCTQDMINDATLHAIRSTQPRRKYYTPGIIRIFSLMPDWMIELMMMAPPPQNMVPTDDALSVKEN